MIVIFGRENAALAESHVRLAVRVITAQIVGVFAFRVGALPRKTSDHALSSFAGVDAPACGQSGYHHSVARSCTATRWQMRHPTCTWRKAARLCGRTGRILSLR